MSSPACNCFVGQTWGIKGTAVDTGSIALSESAVHTVWFAPCSFTNGP